MTSTDTTNVFFGNLPCYVFFRLYQKLYERLLKAKTLADDLQHGEEEESEGAVKEGKLSKVRI